MQVGDKSLHGFNQKMKRLVCIDRIIKFDPGFESCVVLLKNVVLSLLQGGQPQVSLLHFQVVQPGFTTTLNNFDDASVIHVINMITCFGYFSKNS